MGRKKKNSGYMSASDCINNLSVNAINTAIRIAGTDHDRRRKVTAADRQIMCRLVEKCTYTSIARVFGVTPGCVKYSTDPQYRKKVNSQRTRWKNYNNSHFKGEEKVRAEYKMTLVNDGLLH